MLTIANYDAIFTTKNKQFDYLHCDWKIGARLRWIEYVDLLFLKWLIASRRCANLDDVQLKVNVARHL